MKNVAGYYLQLREAVRMTINGHGDRLKNGQYNP